MWGPVGVVDEVEGVGGVDEVEVVLNTVTPPPNQNPPKPSVRADTAQTDHTCGLWSIPHHQFDIASSSYSFGAENAAPQR